MKLHAPYCIVELAGKDDETYENKHNKKRDKKTEFFSGKHIPNRSVSNMSYTNQIKQQQQRNLLSVHKKSRSTHLSHIDVNSSSATSSSSNSASHSRHHSSSSRGSKSASSSASSTPSSSRSSSFDNIVKTTKKAGGKYLSKIDERRVNSATASHKMASSYSKSDAVDAQFDGLQPRRASTANLSTPRSIVIRREKSTNAQLQAPLNTNRSNASERNSLVLSSRVFEPHQGKETGLGNSKIQKF